MHICARQLKVLALLLAGACAAKRDQPADSTASDSASPRSPAVSEAIPPTASTPWDAARLRGADFRAVGQEPGWTLEIHDNEMLRYIGDYGRDTVASTISEITRHPSGTLTYSIRSGQRNFEATIRAVACTDVMSGDAFTHTVTLRVDKQQLSGCGRQLDN